MVASKIVGRRYGVAQQAKFVVVRYLSGDYKQGDEALLLALVKIFDHARRERMEGKRAPGDCIINISLGYYRSLYAHGEFEPLTEEPLGHHLKEEGCIVVMAAGNKEAAVKIESGPDGKESIDVESFPVDDYPAVLAAKYPDHIVVVGGAHQNLDFRNYFQVSDFVKVIAPATGIRGALASQDTIDPWWSDRPIIKKSHGTSYGKQYSGKM